MTDEEVLLSHAEDKKLQCAENFMITSTSFLDLHSRSLLSALEKVCPAEVKTYYYGGFAGAERVVAVFVPAFFEAEDIASYFVDNPQDNPLTLLKLSKDRFSTLTHRDYLGALMGLGIRRELIGDIIVEETQAYIICLESSAKFICENLKSVGRGSVNAEVVPFDELKNHSENTEEINAFVASLRLDNLISALFDVSRTAAVAAIEKGIVYLDDVECSKADRQVHEGAKLVYRGKGKVIFTSVDGKSKKGRLHITAKRYI